MSEENVTESAEKPKRSVREFLKQYRALGLPGAKKFRQRTRREEATLRNTVLTNELVSVIGKVSAFLMAIEPLKDESNWMVNTNLELVWLKDTDPLEIIRQAEKMLLGQSPQVPQPSPSLPSTSSPRDADAEPQSAPIDQP